MKKKSRFLPGILILVIFPVILASHTIEIFNLKAGDVVCRDTTKSYSYKSFSWSINNSMNDIMTVHVRLLLYNADCTNLIQTIDSDTTGSHGEGIYEEWNVNTVAPGSYQIRVQTLDDGSHADSGVFTVENCRTIDVNWPKSFHTYDIGSAQSIHVGWISKGITEPFVKVLLLNESKTQTLWTISTNVSSSSTLFDCPVIPSSVNPGKYVIRVSTLDDTVFGDSEPFLISSPRVINITNPQAGDEFCTGHSCNIIWTQTGTQSSYVSIELKEGYQTRSWIIEKTDHDGSHSWTIPQSIPDGEYKIYIREWSNNGSNTRCYAFSDEFRIKSCIGFNPNQYLMQIPKLKIIPYWIRGLREGISSVVIDIRQLSRMVRKYKVNHQISLELRKPGIPVIKLGTFNPKKTKSATGLPETLLILPAHLKLKFRTKEISSRINPGPGYQLLLKDKNGKVLAKAKITLKDTTLLKRKLKKRRT